jgi:predicted DNA-binding ribbon-helix-helix protein
MRSPIRKRSVLVAGRRTSVSLEDEFWVGLKKVADARNIKLIALVAEIDSKRQNANLSSAIRLFVLDFYQTQVTLLVTQQRSRNRDCPAIARRSAVPPKAAV